LVGVPFELPCEDPWIHGEGTAGHAYLDGARAAWRDHPEWMDFLDPASPCWDLKRAERDLYLHAWRAWRDAKRVLDVGCGIGRFVTAWLDRGADVWGVDGDLDSLRRCAWHAAGRPGRLDLHWSSVHRLPDVRDVDVVIACEVLCYVPDAHAALDAIFERLRPGGALLVSVEARWGWATGEDAPPGAMEEALAGTGTVDVPGDRWVHTYEGPELRTLLEAAGFDVIALDATHYVTDGPLERCMPPDVTLETLLAWEDRCRRHPVWGPLNRAWTGVAIKPR
jgi:SAM-dependent methyltransferase